MRKKQKGIVFVEVPHVGGPALCAVHALRLTPVCWYLTDWETEVLLQVS